MMKSAKSHAILKFQIDDPEAGLNFSKRLANENGWSDEFTSRVVKEYLRFLVLCSQAGHKVTPSDAVDQAWHLHMCYTESYWSDLCRDTLGFPLHHGPTKGGSKEREKFFDWYSKTLDSYQNLFGEEPPLDIWPSPKMRFAPQHFKRIDCTRNFVIPRKLVWLSLLGIGALSCSVGCATSLATVKPESIVLWVLGPLCLIGLLILISRAGNGGGKGGSGGCSGGAGCGGGKSGCGNDSGCGAGCGGGGCGGGCGG